MQLNRCLTLAVLVCSLWTTRAQSDEMLAAIERQLANLDARLAQLFVTSGEQIEALSAEIHHLQESTGDLRWRVEGIQRSVQQVEDVSALLVRNVSKVANQSDQILLNQQYCANHEALKEMFFEWTVKCSASGVPNVSNPVTTTTARPSTTPQPPIAYVYNSCREAPARSGVYRIAYNRTHVVEVFCEQETHGGSWMVFQSRRDGSQNFNESWASFKNGFGVAGGEFWLGLEILNQLYVARGFSELLIVMQRPSGQQAFVLYPSFGVDKESSYYKLLLPARGSGSANDSLFMYRGERFVTHDNGYGSRYGNCVSTLGGAFWHYSCNYYEQRNNLNGVYGIRGRQGIWWAGMGTSIEDSLIKVQMMMRTPMADQSSTTSARTSSSNWPTTTIREAATTPGN